MGFSPNGGNISGADDVALSSPNSNQVLTYDGVLQKWRNAAPSGGGGVPTTYALGRVKYNAGWPGARPTGYAYIDWIKSSPSDPDPASSLMIAGDTISEWQ